MELWRTEPVNGSLEQVPGLGPASIRKLKDAEDGDTQITNTYQLIGHYLMLKGPDTDEGPVSIELTNQKFWYWLKSRGISAHRSAIVLAIYEKVATFFPGFYNVDQDSEEDDE